MEYCKQLRAGPEVVNMKQKSPYLYENIMKLSRYIADDYRKDIIPVFEDAFEKRFANVIVDHADSHGETEQYSTTVKKLTNVEKEMYAI